MRQRKKRGDVTRHTAHSKRRAGVPTARSAHARQGRRRSVGTTTRSRLGARSASPAPAQTEPSRRCDEATGAVMSLDTRRTRNGARLCRQHDRRMHDKVGGARSARRLARGPALARRRRRRLRQSRAGNATRRARGAVMSLDTRRTRNGALVCRQHDRRMYDEVGGAGSARRLARGPALARRRRWRP